MKILISGHTKGIGLAISSYFENKGHEIIGYSRTNGKDLLDKYNIRDFISDSYTADVVIINANLGFDTANLLYKVYDKLKGMNKTIVVLGSRVTEALARSPMPYQMEKMLLEETARQLQVSSDFPTIIILRPGYVDTTANSHVKTKMTSTQSVAELLDWILETNRTKDFKILNLLFAPQ